MPAALYGLLGALGGAFLTAAAAYWGPIQAQRKANVAAAEQARLARVAEAVARAEAAALARDQRAARVEELALAEEQQTISELDVLSTLKISIRRCARTTTGPRAI